MAFAEPPVFRSDPINGALPVCDRISGQKQILRYCDLLCPYLSLGSLGDGLQLTCRSLASGAFSNVS